MADLRDIGLSEYEANAYRALLRTGPATAKELSAESGVPMGRVYDVLGSIESQHLVRSQAASRPKKYVAVEPETALDRLLDDRKRELREKASQYEDVVDDLTRELDEPEAPEDGFWTAAVGPEAALDLLLERIDAASDSVVLVSGTPASGWELDDVSGRVFARLEAAVDRGVEVSVLLSGELARSLPEDVNARYAEVLADEPSYEVRVGESIDGNVTIVDGAEVCLEVSNPVQPGEAFATIDLQDTGFAADVHDAFEESWTDADTLG
jgi:sugar-specific transcriptional regulator TrmB